MSLPTPLTRREFVMRLGGGALAGLTALGLMSRASGQGVALDGLTPVDSRKAKKVVILGAGIAGLTAAYELQKLGIESVIIEPRAKVGGRCITIRKGDVIEETNGYKQTCQFDEGQYFNPGPARFPQWHVTMDYCRELGVPIQPFLAVNENAWFYNEGEGLGPLSGQRIRQREAKADLRGYAAELLAKCVDQDKLDQPLSAEDKERLLDFLTYEGQLGRGNRFSGGTRRGFDVWPGAGLQEGEMGEPNKMDALLQSEVWKFFHRANEYEYQAQMFTPVGGMDNIAHALAKQVSNKIILGAKVKEFRHTNPGIRVVYEENGVDKEITGDFGIVTIPPTILRKLPNDFSPMLKNTLNVVPFQNSNRIGLQFKRRFWEEDDRIFGGITWTNQPIGEIYYPSEGFYEKKGVLVGYYIFGPVSDELGRKTPEERLEFALSQGEKIHPQYRKEFDNAVSFNWSTTPHIEGCLAHFPKAMMKTFYPLLIKPEQETYIAASWATHLGGWQAGAFEAARLTVKSIYDRIQAA
ncbi:MAG: flavin monoamine oxidase family protein [Verrucomicrobiota bacterium JB022]|nr:flavin monoamine oxidase family protein [Verrucomicrobiota bacterium JB022]